MRQVSWRAAAAIGAVLVVTLAACAGEPSKPASPSRSPSPSASGAAKDESPIADPSHAVDIPGKREGTLHSTDLLILSEDTLSVQPTSRRSEDSTASPASSRSRWPRSASRDGS